MYSSFTQSALCEFWRNKAVTAKNLLFTAPRLRRAGRRAVPGSEGRGKDEGGGQKNERLLGAADFVREFRSRKDSCASFVLRERAMPFRVAKQITFGCWALSKTGRDVGAKLDRDQRE